MFEKDISFHSHNVRVIMANKWKITKARISTLEWTIKHLLLFNNSLVRYIHLKCMIQLFSSFTLEHTDECS